MEIVHNQKDNILALIPAYEPKLQLINAKSKHGGFDRATMTFTPFMTYDRVDPDDVLNVITAAAEAGALDSEKWVSQVFGNTEVFESFLEEYAEFDVTGRTYDRWYWALFALSGLMAEEGFVTSSEIADKLREVAEETGQMN